MMLCPHHSEVVPLVRPHDEHDVSKLAVVELHPALPQCPDDLRLNGLGIALEADEGLCEGGEGCDEAVEVAGDGVDEEEGEEVSVDDGVRLSSVVDEGGVGGAEVEELALPLTGG